MNFISIFQGSLIFLVALISKGMLQSWMYIQYRYWYRYGTADKPDRDSVRFFARTTSIVTNCCKYWRGSLKEMLKMMTSRVHPKVYSTKHFCDKTSLYERSIQKMSCQKPTSKHNVSLTPVYVMGLIFVKIKSNSYPDPDPNTNLELLNWIRILKKVLDSSGSGSTTLIINMVMTFQRSLYGELMKNLFTSPSLW
jgi:hypothetical protein